MSSPTDRSYDPGDPSPYAPRWVRNAPPPRRAQVHNPLDREGADESGAEETGVLRNDGNGETIASEQAPPLQAAPPVSHDESFMIGDFRVPRSLNPVSADWRPRAQHHLHAS